MDDFEALDAEAELDAFEMAEMVAKRQLVMPKRWRDGIEAGRLHRVHGKICRVLRRLAYRSFGHCSVVVLRAVDSNEIVRLPFE